VSGYQIVMNQKMSFVYSCKAVNKRHLLNKKIKYLMQKHKHLRIFTLVLAFISFNITAQDMRLFTKKGVIKVSKYRISSQSTLSITDENNKVQDINASEVDSFFLENIKYLSLPKQQGIKTQIVFARVFIEGHYSLLETVKSNEKEMIFWEKDSTALFLNNENDFLQFRGKVFLTQKLELIQMIRTIKFGESNITFGDLAKITNKMNAIFYPKEVIKTRVNSTTFGFYLQGGVSSSDISLLKTSTTTQVAYENYSGSLGPKISTNFGAFVQLNPTKKLTFELGMWYLKYENQKILTISGKTVVDTLHIAMERFSIPFNIRYSFKLKGESIFFLKAGPQFNLNSKLDSWIIPNYIKERRNNLNKENSNGYGFNVGFGYSKNINHLNLAIEYRYSYTELYDAVANFGKHFTNGLYLNVGFIQK
jgi:hypothetical protein